MVFMGLKQQLDRKLSSQAPFLHGYFAKLSVSLNSFIHTENVTQDATLSCHCKHEDAV